MLFFRKIFAQDGDKTAVPFDVDVSGAVSYEEGYGAEYELEQDDPAKRNIERRKLNQLLGDVTTELRRYQTLAFPDFITTSDNGGVPYPYDKKAFVRFDDGAGVDIFESLVDGNETTPANVTYWRRLGQQQASSFVAGNILPHALNTLPSGWLWLNGKTLGSADSGADYAQDDAATLFAGLWDSQPNNVLPIFNSSGVATTRGANAGDDFSANKRLSLPDWRGRIGAGADNMGGVAAAGRLTGASGGVNGSQLGATGGAQTHSLSSNENGAHSHSGSTGSAGNHNHYMNPVSGGTGGNYASGANTFGAAQTGSAGAHTHSLTISSSGSGAAHNNVQPTIITNYIIKL